VRSKEELLPAEAQLTGYSDPRELALATEGVLGRRILAYLLDIVIVFLLMSVLWVLIALFGVITFGFGWMLFALLPLTAIAYNALTIASKGQSTLGMRAAGLRVVEAVDGGRPSMLAAAVHALLFYVAVSTFLLWAIDVVIGLARVDRRLGHDILSGLLLLRSR
jgi:uncharacterized RDD family membrane protein YckC